MTPHEIGEFILRLARLPMRGERLVRVRINSDEGDMSFGPHPTFARSCLVYSGDSLAETLAKAAACPILRSDLDRLAPLAATEARP